jgi:hypothetical protein
MITGKCKVRHSRVARDALPAAWEVHPPHDEAASWRLRHYVLLFHDGMLECLADGTRTHTVEGWEAAKDLAREVVER